MDDVIREYDALTPRPPWALSRMYHEESKLGPFRMQAFEEQILAFEAQAAQRRPATAKLYPTRPLVALPKADHARSRPLREVMRSRRTRRGKFSEQPIPLADIGTLLELACGVTGRVKLAGGDTLPLRAWPSAGGLYPIETYALALRCAGLERAAWYYAADTHHLLRIAECPSDNQLREMIYAEGLWTNAGLLLVLSGVFERTQAKYGERGYRFVLMEAGHVAQNLLLAAEEMNLAAVALGGFHEDALGRALELDAAEESPLYLVLLGRR